MTQETTGMERRDFLRWLGVGAGTAAAELGLSLRLLAAADPDENPLAGSVTRSPESQCCALRTGRGGPTPPGRASHPGATRRSCVRRS